MHYSLNPLVQLLLSISLLPVDVQASPTNDNAEKRANCAQVTGALAVFKAVGPLATSFCSEYLRVPKVSTTKVTVTPTRYCAPYPGFL